MSSKPAAMSPNFDHFDDALRRLFDGLRGAIVAWLTNIERGPESSEDGASTALQNAHLTGAPRSKSAQQPLAAENVSQRIAMDENANPVMDAQDLGSSPTSCPTSTDLYHVSTVAPLSTMANAGLAASNTTYSSSLLETTKAKLQTKIEESVAKWCSQPGSSEGAAFLRQRLYNPIWDCKHIRDLRRPLMRVKSVIASAGNSDPDERLDLERQLLDILAEVEIPRHDHQLI